MSKIAPHAAGATRLLASPQGAFAVAEIRGRWQHEEFHDGDNVPGVLKLLDGRRAVSTAVMGWPLGAPDDAGALLYVQEAPHEYRYRVARTAGGEPVVLAPPGMDSDVSVYWHVKAAVGEPDKGCAAVVLWSPIPGHDWKDPAARRDRLWLASIDRATRTVRASREINVTTPMPYRGRYARGVAAKAGLLALIDVPPPDAADTTYRVHALDCATLETRWTTAVDVSSRSGSPTSSARDERILATADVGFSGNSKWLAVIHGAQRRDIISTPTIFVLNATTGRIAGQLDNRIQYDVSAVIPLGLGDSIALNHFTSVPDGSGHEPAYYGVTVVDLATRKAALAIDASRLRVEGYADAHTVRASAIVAPSTTIELAPDSFAWVTAHDRSGGIWPQANDAIGASRTEVAQWMTAQRAWHRPGRDTVKAHDAWMERTRRQ